ncbi:MAG: 4,5-DOPA dioxygenase extradiol [Pyrinomonadaceae bacterium]|nr:4,5-DOPA dioxygenase extradiol [Pyrinomonadaceae bacterium]
MSDTMPAIFFGHGNPMNAVSANTYTDAWAAIGRSVPKPKAVLCVSAHWYIPGVAVTAETLPRTIHDFGGFPQELYEVQYPAPGSPELAARVGKLLGPITMDDGGWGLDHGTWSVLCHVFPEADVPVVQLSIDARQPSAWHYELGKRLAPLRNEGVLIAGSGNLVHNLRAFSWGKSDIEPYGWAVRFEARARELMLAGDHAPLADYTSLGEDAMLSSPTPDHFLPLLYVLATQNADDAVTFPVEGFDGGSISMLSVQIG